MGYMMTEHELAELVGRLGNSYTKKGLSPPFALRDAVKHWLGLAQDEIVTVLQKHFEDYRRFYNRRRRRAALRHGAVGDPQSPRDQAPAH